MNYFKNFRAKFVLFTFIFFPQIAMAQSTNLIKGIRVDPGYFYGIAELRNKSAIEVAQIVINDLKNMGTNTVFLFAYNPIYGAYYNTNYSDTDVENGYGKLDITSSLIQEAHKNQMKVIAGFPGGNIKKLWEAQSYWRAKKQDGTDFRPGDNYYPLSYWHDSFNSWYLGLIENFITLHPDVDGIEVIEPEIDPFWTHDTDFNTKAVREFRKKYGRKAKYNGPEWLSFRAEGLTQLVAKVNTLIHSYNKESYFVETWTATASGALMNSNDIRDGVGIDFNGVLALENEENTDYLVGEFIWQQWYAYYKDSVFSPAWTYDAGLSFISKVQSSSIPIMHIEMSSFASTGVNITPTNDEFDLSLEKAMNLGIGVDIYSYYLLKENGVFDIVKKHWVP